jgi:hypothetical protein
MQVVVVDLILELVVEPQVQVEQVVEDVEQEEILLLQERLTLAVVVEDLEILLHQDHLIQEQEEMVDLVLW